MRGEIRNIADDIRQTGKEYHVKVIHKKHCDLLGLPSEIQPLFQAQQKLFQPEVIRYADTNPIQYEKHWVDANLVPEFSQQDLNHINTSNYLIKNVPLKETTLSKPNSQAMRLLSC